MIKHEIVEYESLDRPQTWKCKGEAGPDPRDGEFCDFVNPHNLEKCGWCGDPKPLPPSQGPFR